jgi:hypothetical protein
MTLQKKWDEIKGLIEQKTEEFVKSLTGLPTMVYEVGYNGQLKEIPVLGYEHLNSQQLPYYQGKKPTREDVRKIESVYYNLVLDRKFVRYKYDQYNSYSQQWIDDNPRLFIDRTEASRLAKEISDRIAEENSLLAGGDHDRCQRCRKVVPKAQIINHTIIGRGRKAVYNSWKNRYEDKAVVTHEPMKFCSGECVAHEQMSREG